MEGRWPIALTTLFVAAALGCEPNPGSLQSLDETPRGAHEIDPSELVQLASIGYMDWAETDSEAPNAIGVVLNDSA